MTSSPGQNALTGETSPYLLQHATNPVAWFPWSEQALQQARSENKPILLSIGYSACHWCHVMAHESFEDAETAELMNQHFINIKVDREERPDLDSIYQQAQHILTQRTGGWPLTMFLTPDDHLPFFGGTYFPKESRFGLPAFKEVLIRIANFYAQREQDIRQQNVSFKDALEKMQQHSKPSTAELSTQPLQIAFDELQQAFDRQYGGFGQAPKFPHPTNIERLFLHAFSTESADEQQQALEMALYTLEKMARGGIYDHIGGGFSRYSVDQYWMIPHFEKMLYDNGPLLSLYSEAWQITGSPLFKSVATETADWVIREMQSPEGGYYSSLDADSEGEEGKYYVWTLEALQTELNEDEYRYFAYQYGLEQPANFEGQWHAFLAHTLEESAEHFQLETNDYQRIIDSIKTRLFDLREQRIRPGLDDKILGSWNGLMISGMAVAGRILHQADYLDSACKAMDFVIDKLWQDKRLNASYKDGRSHLNAYLDDYAYLIDASLQLLQSRWDTRYLQFAMQLADTILDQFYDREHGGFFFTSHDHEQLIQRTKPFVEDATPNGNGIACLSLLRLGHLTGRIQYIEVAEKTLNAAFSAIEHMPYAHNSMLMGLDEFMNPSQSIIIRGERAEVESWQQSILSSGYLGLGLLYAIPNDAGDLPALLAEAKEVESTVAYVCSGHCCEMAENDREKLLSHLKTMVLQ